jgi:crossover junction endodeoxyribonuclease RusA
MQSGTPHSLTDRDISAIIYVYPPDRRRRDIDNVLKAILDALQRAGVYNDDSQISRLYIERCEPVRGGAVRVILSTFDKAKKLPALRGRGGKTERE